MASTFEEGVGCFTELALVGHTFTDFDVPTEVVVSRLGAAIRGVDALRNMFDIDVVRAMRDESAERLNGIISSIDELEESTNG